MHRTTVPVWTRPLIVFCATIAVVAPTAWYFAGETKAVVVLQPAPPCPEVRVPLAPVAQAAVSAGGAAARAPTEFVFHPLGTPGVLDANHFKIQSEQQVVDVFKKVLGNLEASRWVVDIGMNSGYYTLLSASLGAKVMSFDLQVYCVKIVTELLLAKNRHLLPYIDIFNVGLGTPAIVSVPDNTCDGEFGQGGVPAAGGINPTGKKVTASIVDPKHVLPVWSRAVTLVKVDTEGAEADILTHLLPLVEAGRIQHIVAELMPSQWPNRGSSLEAGLATMKRLTALSKKTVLLYDPGHFPFQKEQLTLPEIPGELWVNFNMEDLVRNRFQGGGCNVWWSFV